MANLIRFVLTQRVLVLALTAVIVALAVQAWQRLPIDAFPDISPTQVKLIIRAPGMTAAEVEAQVTQPIETELLGIPNKSILRSTTKYGITSITLDFHEGTDIYWARQQVTERLAGVWSSLPSVIDGGLAPMSTPLSEIFMLSYNNPNLTLAERRHVLDWQIRPMLRTVAGVAEVTTMGGFVQTYEFSPDLSKLAAAQLSLSSLADWLQVQHLNGSVGRIITGTSTLIVRTEGKLSDHESIASMQIPTALGPVRLDQLGTVQTGHLPRFGGVTHNGEETAQAMVIALKNANTNEVVEQVRSVLDQLEPSLPDGSELNVFYDRADLIETAVATISDALLYAIILVIFVLFVFLADVRAALVVAVSIPLAVLASFLGMEYFGLTANLMSLGGIVIAIGMLVDASVVVVENIVTETEKGLLLPLGHMVYRATLSVAKPVIAGTAIVLIVFSPLLLLTGLEGKLFSPVALTIVFAMISALVVALFVIPVLALSLIKVRKNSELPGYLRALKAGYQTSLNKVIATPRRYFAIALSVLILSGITATFVGKTFMPVLDEGDLIVQLEKHPGISLKESLALDAEIEKRLLAEVPEIAQIVARIGSDELGMDPMGLNETDMFMALNPVESWRFSSKDELANDVREVLQDYPGINFNFTQPIQMRVSEMLTGSSGDVAVKIFGDDISVLAALAQQVEAEVSATAGSVDVQTTLIDGGEFLNIKLRDDISARYGLSNDELARQLRVMVDGWQVAEIIDGRIRTPLMFAGLGSQVQVESVADLADLPIALGLGDDGLMQVAALGEIATVESSFGPSLIERENGSRFAVVTSNVSERDIVGFVADIQARLQQGLQLPAGYTLTFGGEFENQARATSNLLTIVPAVLLVILLILFATFRSLAIAGLVFANIPFALMGGIFALFISGEYLSVPASVGFIALLGVAVLNGVVMLSHFQQLGPKFNRPQQLVLVGASDRLRAILMTATTALLGLIPLALATGPGAEIQKPLALVVIGGLVTSTLTTLYLLPVMYARLAARFPQQFKESH